MCGQGEEGTRKKLHLSLVQNEYVSTEWKKRKIIPGRGERDERIFCAKKQKKVLKNSEEDYIVNINIGVVCHAKQFQPHCISKLKYNYKN